MLSLQEQFGSLQNARLYIPDVNAEIQTNTGTLGTQAPQTKTSVKRQHDISSCPDLLADGTGEDSDATRVVQRSNDKPFLAPEQCLDTNKKASWRL